MAKHLTPRERAAIVATFVETGNASETARVHGVSDMTVMRCVRKAKALRKDELHARAVARGVRDGHRALRSESKRLANYLEAAVGDGTSPSVEPRDYAALVKALTDLNRTMLAHDARLVSLSESKLKRQLLRSQIAVAREGQVTGDVVVVVRSAGSDPAVDPDPSAG